jgi:hypothetical protein
LWKYPVSQRISWVERKPMHLAKNKTRLFGYNSNTVIKSVKYCKI